MAACHPAGRGCPLLGTLPGRREACGADRAGARPLAAAGVGAHRFDGGGRAGRRVTPHPCEMSGSHTDVTATRTRTTCSFT